MYLLMINGHICIIQNKCFNDVIFFNTIVLLLKADILMNLNVLNAWYNGIDNTIYAASCANICWTLKKMFPMF